MARLMLVVAVLLLTACSGAAEPTAPADTGAADAPTADTPAQEDVAPTDPTTPSPPTDGTNAAAAVDTDAFCNALVEAEREFSVGPDVDFENATQEEIEAALSEFAAQIDPALQAVEAQVPEAVADEVTTLTGIIREALESGEEPFDSPEFQQADQAIDDWMADNCAIDALEVTAVDYAFEGMPATMAAGQVGLQLDNQGTEVHELVLFRKAEGVEESFEEILQSEDESKVTFAGAAFVPPGESDTFYADLEAGEYAGVCFIPVGTSSMEVLEAAESTEGPGSPPELGPPHFTEGMITEFTVE